MKNCTKNKKYKNVSNETIPDELSQCLLNKHADANNAENIRSFDENILFRN